MDNCNYWSQFQRDCYRVSHSKGFHADQSRDPAMARLQLIRDIMLVVTELAEAVEDLRAGREPTETHYDYIFKGVSLYQPTIETRDDGKLWVLDLDGKPIMEVTPEEIHETFLGWGAKAKPEGVPIELADAVIRLADLAEAYGIDLGTAIEKKTAYNKDREPLHGKAF